MSAGALNTVFTRFCEPNKKEVKWQIKSQLYLNSGSRGRGIGNTACKK